MEAELVLDRSFGSVLFAFGRLFRFLLMFFVDYKQISYFLTLGYKQTTAMSDHCLQPSQYKKALFYHSDYLLVKLTSKFKFTLMFVED